ncbi:hypothetical protein [Streptomyces sp. 351MFTsu5.1]|uniref:hypothetical protein n=1 Tax=Streptomyces sp. 351MFTsu5.1 TaxID=1172180 RepID=UPI0003709405|nr:hypothetical protein [Streptomyces sp. 351MFTsu5.1]
MTDQPDTARDLLWRHNVPEDVIDGALALFAQELAGKIRAHRDHTRGATQATKVMDFAAELISPDHWARTVPAVAPPADRAALRDRIAEALYASDHPGHLVPLHETGLVPAYAATADAVLAVLPAPADRAAEGDPTAAELTAQEARDLADELGTELYRAQDALAFVEECCVIADREGRQPTTADVREWLKGARCGRQLLADAQEEIALRDRIRRVLAQIDGFDFDSLEPHDYQIQAAAIAAVLPASVDRADETAEDEVARLSQWLWDNCAEDERSGLLADDPRRIAAVALRWPELRRVAADIPNTTETVPCVRHDPHPAHLHSGLRKGVAVHGRCPGVPAAPPAGGVPHPKEA